MRKLKTILFGLLSLSIGSCNNPHGEVIRQESDSQKGYNFPYLLFLPQEMNRNEVITLIVEPNNTGRVSDDFDNHVEGAEQIIYNFGHIGKFLADSLRFPLLVPIFPRSEKEWKIYTHSLDTDAIKVEEGAIKRIDLQLMSMIDDAKLFLAKMGYSVQEKVIMTGFSASATFANRFTFLHPERVQLCIAGGLNGMLILPVENLNGTLLNYPLGTHDFYKVLNDSFDLPSLKQIPQFLFMGAADDNDAVSFDDAYDSDERAVVYRHFGKDLTSRWKFCGDMYQAAFLRAIIKTYDNTGHTITNDIRTEALMFAKKWTFESGQINRLPPTKTTR